MIDPEKLASPYQGYNGKNITKKNLNKEVFQKNHGLVSDGKSLLVGILIPKEYEELLAVHKVIISGILEGISHIPYIQPVLLVEKESLQKKNSHGYIELAYRGKANDTAEILGSVDAFLFPLPDIDLDDTVREDIQRFGGVIIAHQEWQKEGILEEYNPFSERGNSFFFTEYDPWNIVAIVIRVFEVCKFPYDWNTLRRLVMRTNFSDGNE